jgi:hypothetical protein
MLGSRVPTARFQCNCGADDALCGNAHSVALNRFISVNGNVAPRGRMWTTQRPENWYAHAKALADAEALADQVPVPGRTPNNEFCFVPSYLLAHDAASSLLRPGLRTPSNLVAAKIQRMCHTSVQSSPGSPQGSAA